MFEMIATLSITVDAKICYQSCGVCNSYKDVGVVFPINVELQQ